MKKVIGLDLDGVIVDLTKAKLELAQRFGLEIKEEETASDIYKHRVGFDTFEKIRKLLYDEPSTALNFPLMSGAKEGLSFLKENRLPYFLISRRDPSDNAFLLLKKLELWPDFFWSDNVFFVREKIDKEKTASSLGINTYIDDQPSVLMELASVKNKFLFDPLTAYRNPSGPYKIVRSWQEFISHLSKL